MIAGRLHWRPARSQTRRPQQPRRLRLPQRLSRPHRSRLQTPRLPPPLPSQTAAKEIDPGGLIDVFAADLEDFRAALTAENRTLKRALTDPRILSGIGNAYSDEILHAAQLSPILQTHKLTTGQWQSLYTATHDTLQLWIDRLNTEAAASLSRKSHRLPQRHGRPRPLRPTLPHLRPAHPAHPLRRQRNQLLPQCQTDGKVLADRSLSRLLGADWPRTLDELEALKKR